MGRAGFILIILSLIIAGCEKDEKLLIGKWNKVSSALVTYDGDEVLSDTTYYYESGKNVLELLADGTAKANKYSDQADTYKWTVSGKFLIISYFKDFNFGSQSNRYEYYVKDSMLYLISRGYTRPYSNKYRFLMTDTYTGF